MSKIIYLDAGHGAGDPGAVGSGTTEEKMAIKIVNALEKWYKKYGVTVHVHPHTKNSYRDGFYKTFYADNTEVLEVHFNASTNSSATGTEVLTHPDYEPDALDRAFLDASDDFTASRGIKNSDHFFNMDWCAINGVPYRLLEVAFISNKNDMAKFDTDKEVDNYAKRIVEKTYKLLGGKAPQETEEKETKKYAYVEDETLNSLFKYKMRINQDRAGAIFSDPKCTNSIGTMRNLEKARDGEVYVISRFSHKLEKDGYIWYVHQFISESGYARYFAYKLVEK